MKKSTQRTECRFGFFFFFFFGEDDQIHDISAANNVTTIHGIISFEGRC